MNRMSHSLDVRSIDLNEYSINNRQLTPLPFPSPLQVIVQDEYLTQLTQLAQLTLSSSQPPISEEKKEKLKTSRLIDGPFTFKEQQDNFGTLNALPSELLLYCTQFLSEKELGDFRQASFATFCLARQTFAKFEIRKESRYQALTAAAKGGMPWPAPLHGLLFSRSVRLNFIAQGDKEMILGLINQGSQDLQDLTYFPNLLMNVAEYASSEIKNLKEVGLALVAKRGLLLRYLGDSLKKDPEIALKAIENDDLAFFFIADELKENESFLVKAASCNSAATLHMNKKIVEENPFLKSCYKKMKEIPISFLSK